MKELRRFEPARMPETLRTAVLVRAREAAVASSAPSRTDRIFYSRGWRLAWVTAIAALVFAEAIVVRTAQVRSPRGTVATVAREADATAEALGLGPGVRVGARVVTGDEGTRGLTENPL